MDRTRVLIVCGGQSAEHEVSLVSALSVARALDKEVAKRLLRDAGLPVVPFFPVRLEHWAGASKSVMERAEELFGSPYFVKPSNCGSSVGVHKVRSLD